MDSSKFSLKKGKYNLLKSILIIVIFSILIIPLIYAGDVVVQDGRIDVSGNIFVDTDNEVGIGTTSPDEKLHVVGGNIKVEDINEVFVGIKNTEASGRDWALVSAGSAGGIGVGKFAIYDRSLGQSRLTIDTSGNVGIGTMSPTRKLQVVGGDIDINSDNSYLFFGSGDAGIRESGSDLKFETYTGTALTEKVRITGGGNVGIGTTSPGTKLAVDESTDAFAQINIDSGSTASQYSAIDFADRGSNKWGIGKNPSNEFYIDQTGVGNALTIDINRDITVAGNINALSGTICDSNGCIGGGGGATGGGWNDAGTDVILITSSDKVGIGTSSPGAKLHTVGNANALRLQGTDHVYIEFYPDGAATRKGWLGFGGGTDNNIRLTNEISGADIILDPINGNVGIGTLNPGTKLDVSGTIRGTDITCTDCLNAGDLAAGSVGTSEASFANQNLLTSSSPTFANVYLDGTQIEGLSGRNYFRDTEGAGNLRVGAAWGFPGIYAESGDVVVGSATGIIRMQATGTGDVRAGLFRDGNSGWYVDPASTSNLNSVTASTITLGGVSRSSWPSSSESDTLQTVTNRGRTTTQNIRSPRFEDNNNPGFYVDPASTSNLNLVNIRGQDTDARYINVGESGDSIADNTIDSSELQADSVGASELTSTFESGSAYDSRFINVGESGDSIADNTIDSSEIQDNTLTASDLAENSVGTSELRTGTGSLIGQDGWFVSVQMNDYSFFPNLDNDNCEDGHDILGYWGNSPGDTVGRFGMRSDCEGNGGGSWNVYWRYVSASDLVEIISF